MIRFSLLLSSIFLLSACSFFPKTKEPHKPIPPQKAEMYDINSWKIMIPKSCNSFFDGCNNCHRIEGKDIAACTRMFCQHYQKPKCLDEEKK